MNTSSFDLIVITPLKRCQIFVLFFTLTLSCGVIANTENIKPPIKVVTEFLPPYQIVNHDGSLDGYSIEFMELLLEEAGINSEIKVFPWARSYKIASTQENVIIFTMTRTPERENKFNWIGMINEERYLFVKVKSDQELTVNSVDDIKNTSVIVTRNSVGDQLITRLGFTNIIRANNLPQLINMVQLNRADLVMASDYTYNNSLKPLNSTKPKEIVYIYKQDFSGLYVAVSKPSDPELISRLKRAFSVVESTGILEKLKVKWQLRDDS